MTTESGNVFLLQVESAPGSDTYIVAGCFTDNGVSQTQATTEIHTKCDAVSGAEGYFIPQKLALYGVENTQFSGSGRSTDSVGLGVVAAAYKNKSLLNYKITSTHNEWAGVFVCSAFNYTGSIGEAVTFDITLDSSGEVSHTQLY